MIRFPVKVRMEAFTPFIPLNADDSGIPTAVIRYRIVNPQNGARRCFLLSEH